MQIVFLNRLDRVDAAGESRGQVYIGEHQGTWTAGWRTDGPGEPAADTVWYEGVSWEELLAAFRHGIAGKMKEGYRPLIDGMVDTAEWERQPSLPLLLQCYADQQQADAELLARLQQWRRAKSAEEKRAAYWIANNRELHLLAVFRPATAEELGQLPGFGKVKSEKYAAELAAMFKDIPRGHAFPLDWVSKEVAPEQFQSWMFRLKEERYGKQLTEARDKRSLLAGIRDGKTLADMENLLQCPRRQLLERLERLDEEGYDVLPIVERELEAVPPEEWSQASEAMSRLGDRYLKPLLRHVYGEAGGEPQETERNYEKLRMMRIRFRRARQTAI